MAKGLQKLKIQKLQPLTAEPGKILKTKTTIHFADTWREFFETHRMKSYDDFFDRFDRGHQGDETKSKKNKSDVQMFTAGPDKNKTTFFLKRFYNPGYKNTIRAWMQYGRPISHGKLEWSNANLLLSNGIGAYKPVCYGEKTVCGFEVESFVVTEKLAAQGLGKFVFHKWKSLPADDQNNIIIEIAKTVRKVHSLNVSMRDLYVGHIFISGSDGKYNLSFIDLENMSQNVINPFQKARDLGRLCYSMADEYFDRNSKELLIDTYLANVPSFRKGLMKYLIISRAKEMSKRRKLAAYRP